MKYKQRREKSYEERLDDYLLRNIFAKQPNAAPKHPILSSPFARRISESAFGPKKPKWYKRLTSSQHRLFKEILHHVEVAMGGHFKFSNFLKALQKFDPTVTRTEVTDILYEMEIEEEDAGELDLGRFLFLLAYKDQGTENDEDHSDGKTTSRQCLILSAITSFVLNTTLEDVEKYYSPNGRQKSEVLQQRVEGMRLEGLSEKEMEIKQKDINKKLSHLYHLTGSPYTQPLPVVRSIKKKKIFGGPKRTAALKSETSKIDDMDLELDAQEEKLIREINSGKIPLPKISFSPEMQRQLRTEGYTIEMQDCIMHKAEEARQGLRDKMKEAKIVYAKKHLRAILLDGFSSKEEMDSFIKIYQRYFPLDTSDAKNSTT